mgnify:CR=1 FL=1
MTDTKKKEYRYEDFYDCVFRKRMKVQAKIKAGRITYDEKDEFFKLLTHARVNGFGYHRSLLLLQSFLLTPHIYIYIYLYIYVCVCEIICVFHLRSV